MGYQPFQQFSLYAIETVLGINPRATAFFAASIRQDCPDRIDFSDSVVVQLASAAHALVFSANRRLTISSFDGRLNRLRTFNKPLSPFLRRPLYHLAVDKRLRKKALQI